MQTEILNGEEVNVIEVAKSPSGEPIGDRGNITDNTGAMISTYSQDGFAGSNDSTSSISSGQALPEEYRFNQEQVTANMAAAISSDVQGMTEAELIKDETFAAASIRVNSALYGREFLGTNEEAAIGGIELMRKVDNILLNPSKESLAGFAHSVSGMSPEDATASLYMMKMFEAKDATMQGTADALGYMGLDLANYVGVGTLGFAFAGKQAAKVAAKKGMIETLEKIAFSNTGIGAIEGGVYTTAFAAGKESIEADAQNRDMEYGGVAIEGAVGATLGAATGKYLPEAFDYAGQKMGKWLAKDGSIDIAKVKYDADIGDMEAIQVYEDIGLLEGYFGRKIDDFEITPVGQAVTGVKNIIQNEPSVRQNIDELIVSVAELIPKQKQKRLSAAMRDATPDEKEKLKTAMRSAAPEPKPKTPKVQAKIDEREEFNSHFYSKLEHEMNKVPDDMEFKNGQELIDYLKKQGVKQDEIDATGLKIDRGDLLTGRDAKDSLPNRKDKIQKRSYTDEDFGGSDGNMNRDDWESEWTTRYDQEEVSVGEAGFGLKIEDTYTGDVGEVGITYNDDIYVDAYETEFTYDEMLDEFMSNDADDYIATARDELADELEIDAADVDSDAAYEKAREAVLEDGSYQDNYFSKTLYETEDGQTFDDLEDAVDNTYNSMYEDYQSMAAEREGNSFEGNTVDGGDDYRMEVYQMEDFASDKNIHEEPHLGEDYSNEMEFGNENVQVHTRVKQRENSDGNIGDVLEELQSQWEQDWRKEGGNTAPSDQVVKKAEDRLVDIKKEYEVEKQSKVKINHEIDGVKVAHSNLNKEEKFLTDKTDMVNQDEAGFVKEMERIMKGQNDLLLKKTGLERDRSEIQKNIDSLNGEAKKIDKEVINWTASDIATPPIQNRNQYEKVVLLDNILNGIEKGNDFFGWINGHIQNGSATPDSQLTGMTQAYDKEMPRIVQKATGETPYMASFKDGMPISGEKVYWDSKQAADDMSYYDGLAKEATGIKAGGDNWYWKIDFTDAVKNKLKDAKIQMYGVGGAALVGANGVSLEQGEDNAN